MKKSVLLIASLCLVTLGVLGYTFLYAGSTSSNENKECASACEKAHAGAYTNAASGDCPYAAKSANKSAEECCAAKGAANDGHDKGSCPTYAKLGNGMSKEECAKFHETAKAKAESKEVKIEIK